MSYDYPTAASALSDHPTFTHQSVSKDGTDSNLSIWTHAVTKSGGLVSTYTITDPTQTSTTTNLFTSGWQTGLVSSVVTKNSSGTTLRTVTNDWTIDSDFVSNVRILRVTTSLNDVSPALQSKVEFSYTSYGNVSEVREYDFGLVLVRKTQTDYLTATAYTDRHILDRPTQVRVYDGSGALKAKTVFAYDTTELQLVTPVQWMDLGTTARGNLTSITRYATPQSDGGPQTRTFDFDSAGNVRRGDVDCCQSEEWTYTATTQFAYLETTKHGPATGIQLTSSQTYDFSTGLVTSVTDFNGKTTTFEYDVMNRVWRVTRPDGVSATTDYDDASLSPVVTSTMPIDPGRNLVRVVTADGLGRTVKVEVKDGASNTYSIVETQYDDVGRVKKASNPYAPGQTPVWTETQYDALGRPTKVIPPDGSPSSNHTAFTYSGNKVTITDPARQAQRLLLVAHLQGFAHLLHHLRAFAADLHRRFDQPTASVLTVSNWIPRVHGPLSHKYVEHSGRCI